MAVAGAIDAGQLQKRLHAAAESLNELYQLCDQDLSRDSERLIFDVFHQLKMLFDAEVVRSIYGGFSIGVAPAG